MGDVRICRTVGARYCLPPIWGGRHRKEGLGKVRKKGEGRWRAGRVGGEA